ncbi:methylglyoxal synthase [Roseofilum sp. BLCC_M154]|uniref:Methylglyoxal synthase n=1 Tax=Roseofilum acuticapitatum BLCC-M154 TaxID=3022444 RepID=A0ABT7AQ67_9CYAN|nr:methylglyoxal synthase [Roseofilum acuticapitatum]MDJ1169045.1 methylglyoxal synthase [Roseofilum acuticapitatum BLCC-M154]
MSQKIALIAHDSKKDDIVNFAQKHAKLLSCYPLIATGTTGERIASATGLTVERMLSGPMGGDAQIAAAVATGKVRAVIFLIDPLYAQPHEPDINALLRICEVHNVALATNLSTAEAVITSLRRTRRAHLIFNPVSGQGNSQQDLLLIRQLLEPYFQLTVSMTTPDDAPEELAKVAIAQETDLIIASGGDGTVSAVAGALINTDIPLGVIPRGTANAFANALGIISSLTPIRSACDVIVTGMTRVVDVGLCNGKTMILLAGVGYEAGAIEKADREAKNRWGPLAYIMAGWKQVREQELFEVEMEIDGVLKTFQAGAITIANAAPPTSVMAQGMGQVIPDDGLLEVVIITAETKLATVNAMIDLFGSGLTKTPIQRDDTLGVRTRKVKVATHPPQKVVLDGEIIGTTPIEVECIPKGLTVLAPPANQRIND